MELNIKEKKKLLENLKHRMLRIERVIGDITFYDKNSQLKKNSEKSIDNKKNNLINEFTECSNQLDGFENSDEYKNNLDQIKSSLQNLSIDLCDEKKKDELIEIVKKHKHNNSISVHICIIKLILEQISKDFLHDVYSQYKEFYIYIHSSSILDVYSAFEYKRNIILSHINFMKCYSSQIKQAIELKDYINSQKISETDSFMNRLNEIEAKSRALFSKISAINASLENVTYKYALITKIFSLILSKRISNIS
ncbi:conserved Plasmodium protein, unknown function [Plasmodium chabaudi chabaudi]|uniref:Uncharacterized protein n=1 Tax=Plasmodium chabaudi chabaudi TaxID=31271 RepID=A0A1D3S4T3_PLACU|nr:conserved Plasmodium protein, unknown function [Plasmodium chabaudi chabaudi]